jgi:phage protein D
MSIRRPSIELTAGGTGLSGPEAAVVSLQCGLAVGAAMDYAIVVCTLHSPLVDVSVGDDFTIGLGYEGDESATVLSGNVSAIDYSPSLFTIEVAAATSALARYYHAGSYVQQTIGDIVSDLVAQAGVTTGTIEASQSLAAYHVDERRAVWSHVVDLSNIADLSLTTSAAGALEMREPKSSPVASTLRYGAELLLWQAGPRQAAGIAFQAAPHGAGSEAGSEKWHILLKDPTGGSPDAPMIVLPAARDRETADAFSQAEESRKTRRGLHGRAIVTGTPALRAGDVVAMVDLPAGEDLTFRCRSVCHEISPDLGFTTHMLLEATL